VLFQLLVVILPLTNLLLVEWLGDCRPLLVIIQVPLQTAYAFPSHGSGSSSSQNRKRLHKYEGAFTATASGSAYASPTAPPKFMG
jgi:hypothetical protein